MYGLAISRELTPTLGKPKKSGWIMQSNVTMVVGQIAALLLLSTELHNQEGRQRDVTFSSHQPGFYTF